MSPGAQKNNKNYNIWYQIKSHEIVLKLGLSIGKNTIYIDLCFKPYLFIYRYLKSIDFIIFASKF
jgi:hypothetical protein